MLQYTSRIYRLTGTTPILGSAPASKEIRTKYIISKAKEEDRDWEREENGFDRDEQGLTVFNRNRKEELCLMSHQIKGFLKEAFGALKSQVKILAYTKKVDTLISVEPKYIPITRNGKPLTEDMLERPLRGETPQGPRIALQGSEMINDPWQVEFMITLFPSEGTKMSKPLTWESIETALDYGAFHGMGQWRGADWGHFVWKCVEILEDDRSEEA